MNKILNPFEYLSNAKAVGWALAGTIFSICVVLIARWPIGWDATRTIWILSTNLLLWAPLSTLLYLAALVFSPSRIRAVDIFSMNFFAILPTIVLAGLANAINILLGGVQAEAVSFAGVIIRIIYYLLVLLLSVSVVWSMVWGCFAYSVSANMKGIRGIVIFVICYICVSVAIQLLAEYY